ncbi:MAG: GspE/PulE family protein [bacterium]
MELSSAPFEKQSFERIALDLGFLGAEEIAKYKVAALSDAEKLEDYLKENTLLTPEQLLKIKATQLNIPVIDTNELTIPRSVLTKLPEAVAAQYKILPFKEGVGRVSVAMSDPQDLTAIEFLEKTFGKSVEVYLTSSEGFENIIAEQYSRSIGLAPEVSSAVEEAEGEVTKIQERIQNIETAEQTIRDAPVARVVSTVLEYAVKARASDIHIEPQEDRTRIRYRIDGIMSERLSVPINIHSALVSRIKILSHLKLDERRKAQDGRFKIEYSEKRIDLRVSILPTVYGEKVVIRLLKDQGNVLDFQKLGFSGIALKRMEDSVKQVNGIILVTGPTGSGKTVTLATALAKINDSKINITTLEDPIEIRIPGVTQTQVNPDVGLTFATGLRSILRQDPDVIMVGEVRDTETAELAIHAALTGHLVLSTLHTNSAAGALPRLLDMGAEPYLLTSTINYVFAQRLARRICPKCLVPEEALPEVVEDFKKVLGNLMPVSKIKDGKLIFNKGKGCDVCGKSGYTGRLGIFEALQMSPKISKMVLEHSTEADIEKQAVEEGMVTLIQDGYLKVLNGLTTLEEVLRVARE